MTHLPGAERSDLGPWGTTPTPQPSKEHLMETILICLGFVALGASWGFVRWHEAKDIIALAPTTPGDRFDVFPDDGPEFVTHS